MIKLSMAAAAAVLLAGCGTSGPYRSDAPLPVSTNPSPVQAHPLARSVSYTCEDLTTVVMTEGQSDVRATLNSGLELSLTRMGGLNRYGAPPYEFRPLGGEGTFINRGNAYRCRAK